MSNFEEIAKWYYSDNEKLKRKACTAGKYIDKNGMTPTAVQFWIKYFDWWNDDFTLKCPLRFEQYINEFEKFHQIHGYYNF